MQTCTTGKSGLQTITTTSSNMKEGWIIIILFIRRCVDIKWEFDAAEG